MFKGNSVSQSEENKVAPELIEAQERFQNVLQRLESSLQIVSERSKTVKSIEDRALELTTERTQLNAKVNNMTARLEGLENANQDVSGRLGQAMETVRSVLQENGE